MNIFKIISLCLSSFALGWLLCTVLYMILGSPKKPKKSGAQTPNYTAPPMPKTAPAKSPKNCNTCRYSIRKGWTGPCQDCIEHDEWKPINDPRLLLKQYPWESPREFADRVVEAVNEGRLTINAARMSMGLPPIKEDANE